MQRACKSKGRSSSSKTKRKSKPIRQVRDEEEREDEESEEDSDDSVILKILNQAKSSKADAPLNMVKIKLDDCVVDMEVDTVRQSP